MPTGTYDGVTLNGSYFISNNLFYLADVDTQMKGYRAYISLPGNTNVKSLSILDDSSTGIRELSVTLPERYFNINGQAVAPSRMKHGIYVTNGKKIIVK